MTDSETVTKAAINYKSEDISEVRGNELFLLEVYVENRLVIYQRALVVAFIMYRSSNINAGSTKHDSAVGDYQRMQECTGL